MAFIYYVLLRMCELCVCARPFSERTHGLAGCCSCCSCYWRCVYSYITLVLLLAFAPYCSEAHPMFFLFALSHSEGPLFGE